MVLYSYRGGWILCQRGVLRFKRCVVCGGVRLGLGGSVAWSGIFSPLGRRRGARVSPLVGACFGPSCGRGCALWWRRRLCVPGRSPGLRSPRKRRWRGGPSVGVWLLRLSLGSGPCRHQIRRSCWRCSVPPLRGRFSRRWPGRFRRFRCGRRAVGGDLAGFLFGAPVVGFSGSRVSGGPLCVAARGACAAVPPGVPVSVGCASGVDAVVRGAFPRATVFAVSSGRWGSGRGAFARRSAALVRSLLPGGVLVVLPLGPCPPAVSPSSSPGACWCGGGSGSWASAAFALGLGLRVALWAPAVPWFVSAVPLGGGWWGLRTNGQ